jgi:hypothetical protein
VCVCAISSSTLFHVAAIPYKGRMCSFVAGMLLEPLAYGAVVRQGRVLITHSVTVTHPEPHPCQQASPCKQVRVQQQRHTELRDSSCSMQWICNGEHMHDVPAEHSRIAWLCSEVENHSCA